MQVILRAESDERCLLYSILMVRVVTVSMVKINNLDIIYKNIIGFDSIFYKNLILCVWIKLTYYFKYFAVTLILYLFTKNKRCIMYKTRFVYHMCLENICWAKFWFVGFIEGAICSILGAFIGSGNLPIKV